MDKEFSLCSLYGRTFYNYLALNKMIRWKAQRRTTNWGLDLSSKDNNSYLKELNDIIDEWNAYRRALRGEEREAFDKIIKHAKVHVTAG